MLAMQYSFTFPADYDMSIIRKRISERGGQLDGYPNMQWKTYLWTEKTSSCSKVNNSYAPFYLWDNNDGMNSFLCSSGFGNLCRDFGRPNVEIWSVSDYFSTKKMKAAKFMLRQIAPIASSQLLSDLQHENAAFAKQAIQEGAASVVTAFDPLRWRSLRITTWEQSPKMLVRDERYDYYNIGYVALGNP